MIRAATHHDIQQLAELGEAFVREGHYASHMPINREALRAYMTNAVVMEQTAILIDATDDTIAGMIGLQVINHPMSGERVAGELFWYVRPEHRTGIGRELMKAAEAWARERGAIKLQMTAPDDRVAAVYARRGFRRIETTYQKELA